ncbi:MAG TPA: hypothetical protein VJC39_00150 [Candidatus Nanoarchaeia archaeon]|nr:hypothetical protein [Candidatus Nanoarchaeia archaeon]
MSKRSRFKNLFGTPIGFIPYLSLEGGEVVSQEAVYVYRDKYQRLFFEGAMTNPVLGNGMNLERVFKNAVNNLNWSYAGFFSERMHFNKNLKNLLCQHTYLEDQSSYDKRHNPKGENKSIGKYYSDDRDSIKKGIYIKMSDNTLPDLERILGHENGHAMHHNLCDLNITGYEFDDYDEQMIEVFAILAARRVEDYIPNYKREPHLTAKKICKQFISDVGSKHPYNSLKRQWEFMFPYTNHVELMEFLGMKPSKSRTH